MFENLSEKLEKAFNTVKNDMTGKIKILWKYKSE